MKQILGLQPCLLPAAAYLGKWTRGSGKVMRLISGKPALLSCLYSTIVDVRTLWLGVVYNVVLVERLMSGKSMIL